MKGASFVSVLFLVLTAQAGLGQNSKAGSFPSASKADNSKGTGCRLISTAYPVIFLTPMAARIQRGRWTASGNNIYCDDDNVGIGTTSQQTAQDDVSIARPIIGGVLLGAAAQADSRINIYRFVLGVDVPEPPALVAMGLAPSPILMGSAPKPVAAHVLAADGPDSETALGVALDVAPYYLAGGGIRDLTSYRSRSIGGRLLRVLTKTLLSVGVVRPPSDVGSPLVAVGVRATFHDPHDPVLNTQLPEEVAAALGRLDIGRPKAADESVTDRGADLSTIYARARRRMRRRSGDVQVSGGWGVTARAAGSVLDDDSLRVARHTFWVAGQYTAGARFDVLTAAQLRNAFRDDDDRFWLGAALRRKGEAADVQAGVYYDTASRDFHPTVAVDGRLSKHLGVVASLGTQPDPPALTGPRRVRFAILARWFAASDRLGP